VSKQAQEEYKKWSRKQLEQQERTWCSMLEAMLILRWASEITRLVGTETAGCASTAQASASSTAHRSEAKQRGDIIVAGENREEKARTVLCKDSGVTRRRSVCQQAELNSRMAMTEAKQKTTGYHRYTRRCSVTMKPTQAKQMSLPECTSRSSLCKLALTLCLCHCPRLLACGRSFFRPQSGSRKLNYFPAADSKPSFFAMNS